jgi:hypothetical protein
MFGAIAAACCSDTGAVPAAMFPTWAGHLLGMYDSAREHVATERKQEKWRKRDPLARPNRWQQVVPLSTETREGILAMSRSNPPSVVARAYGVAVPVVAQALGWHMCPGLEGGWRDGWRQMGKVTTTLAVDEFWHDLRDPKLGVRAVMSKWRVSQLIVQRWRKEWNCARPIGGVRK